MNHTETEDTLDVVMLSTGSWRIGFEARHVSTARPAKPDAAQEKDTKTIEALLGLPPSTTPPSLPQWLALKQANTSQPVLVSGPVELLALPITSIHPLPPLLGARNALNGLRALVFQDNNEQIGLLFDLLEIS